MRTSSPVSSGWIRSKAFAVTSKSNLSGMILASGVARDDLAQTPSTKPVLGHTAEHFPDLEEADEAGNRLEKDQSLSALNRDDKIKRALARSLRVGMSRSLCFVG